MELADFTSSGNLTRSIQNKKTEINAMRAEYEKIRIAEQENRMKGKAYVAPVGRPSRMSNLQLLQHKLSVAKRDLEKLERNKSRKNIHDTGILDYILVKGRDSENFTLEVMKKMAEGYTLHGGISHAVFSLGPAKGYDEWYTQALVKPLNDSMRNREKELNTLFKKSNTRKNRK